MNTFRGHLSLIAFSVGCAGASGVPEGRGGGPSAMGASMARDVSASLRAIREKHGLPGMVCVLLKDGQVVAQGFDGARKRGSPEKVTLDDSFHIGSCTKSMTATMIATLVDEDKLRWTTTVGEAARGLGMKIHAGWDRVTLEQLLIHRGGAPPDIEEKLWARLWTHSGTPSDQRQALADGVLLNPPLAPRSASG